MKKAICILLVLSLALFSFCPCVSANETDKENRVTEYLEDGSYLVTVSGAEYSVINEDAPLDILGRIIKLIRQIIDALTGTRHISKTKYVSYYDSKNVLIWTFYLNADFSYNGKTSSCTRASLTYDIKDNDWKVISYGSFKESNYAVGSFSVRQNKLGVQLKTINKQITIICSKDGKVE